MNPFGVVICSGVIADGDDLAATLMEQAGGVAADVAEAEEVGDQERFDAARVEARERAKREAEQKARGRALPPGKSG